MLGISHGGQDMQRWAVVLVLGLRYIELDFF